ncbi:MAG TPA: DUF5011 domain-containing protein, partial [Candidatus Hydrogenedentes bacterium]|nr:DUF5011 domain-containing protein [Candidatus Hydrogenedentota bacterium]
ITTGLPIDTQVVGVYFVTYEVSDVYSTTTEQRRVDVVDTKPPVLTRIGPAIMTIQLGDTYVEQGATAVDDCDGPLPVIIGGDTVDTNTLGIYVVMYSVADGQGNSAGIETRVIYVIAELLNFTEQPQGAEVYVDAAPFDLSATFSGGQDVTTYTWFKAGVGSVATGPVVGDTVTLTINPASVGVGQHTYHVEITDVGGQTASESATVVIGTHMSITDDIESATIKYGDPHELSVTVAGGLGVLQYQWYKDGDQIVDIEKLWVGSDTPTLSFPSFAVEDEGAYQLLISDNYETLPSSLATLTGTLGLPAAGAISLALLSAMSALGGALALRRRK